MMQFIISSFFICAISIVNAQSISKTFKVGDVVSDTSTLEQCRFSVIQPSILNSTNKIEIRFTVAPTFNYRYYIILSLAEEWKANYYYHNDDTLGLLMKQLAPKINLDTLFNQLVANEIFSLPSQNSLRTELHEYNPETNQMTGSEIMVYDGISYSIEFKIGDSYRRYYYNNPEQYADFYSHVHELRSFVNIVELFETLIIE